MVILNEEFTLIGTFSGIRVFDSKHAVQEFRRWFPQLSTYDFKKAIQQGIDIIKKLYGMKHNQYMIISKSNKIRIPIEVRSDRRDSYETVGIIPTTLGEFETIALRKEIEVFAEGNQKSYMKVPLQEGLGFSYFAQHGKVFEDFDIIVVD